MIREIKVTESCIRRGRRKNATLCPVALAMAARGFTSVIVGQTRIGFMFEKKWFWSDLNLRTQSLINAFDSGQKIKPFTFTVKYWQDSH